MRAKTDSTIEDQLPSRPLNSEGMDGIYSDHLPKLYTVPLDEANSFKVLSYNTLASWAFPGFDTEDNHAETQEEEEKRHNRICLFFILVVNKQKPDLISLQETTHDLAKKIQAGLGKDFWGLTSADGNRAILYRKSQFTLEKGDFSPKSVGKKTDIFGDDFRGAKLTHDSSKKKIAVFSAHLPHDASLDVTEQAIDKVRNEFSDDDLVLFAADFNKRIAHTGPELQDNANNLIPPRFRSGKTYDFTDGCFLARKDEDALTQIDGISLSPSHPEEAIQRRTELGNQDYKEELNFEPVLFGKGHFLPVVGIQAQNILSVQDLENSLRIKTNQGSEDLKIEVLANRFNQKKIAIYSKNSIPELEEMGIKKNEKHQYELEFDYQKQDEASNIIGLRVKIPNNEPKTIPLSSLTPKAPSASMALDICAGVLAALAGAALVIGILAVAGVITAIAPPIGIAMIAGGVALGVAAASFFFPRPAKDNDNSSEELLKPDPK